MKTSIKAIALFIGLAWPTEQVFGQTEKENSGSGIQQPADTLALPEYNLRQIQIEATRAHERVPMTYTDLDREDIKPLNTGQDIPYVLRFTPSLVVTSDAGNGIGYSGLWIRGSDPSRVNVTINGIPLNDPESQQVFWVNTPDIISSTNSVQIQRGVGTSANGVASFGGLIKMETTSVETKAYARIQNTVGSFGSRRHSIQVGTGLLQNRFVVEGRLSRISSDGYIDRARTDLSSFSLTGVWLGKKSQLTLTAFGGVEETYQSWYGSPAELVEGGTEESLMAFAGRNGLTELQTQNLLNAGRTYNFYTYDDQVDRYGQDHYQTHFKTRLRDNLYFNISGHYTRGKGYFEEYKEGDLRGNYGLNPLLIAEAQVYSDGLDENGQPVQSSFPEQFEGSEVVVSQTPILNEQGEFITDEDGNVLLQATAEVDETDVVRRRWLDNHFYGVVFSFNWAPTDYLITFGGAANQYRGDHFGEVKWMQWPGEIGTGYRYYEGESLKEDINIYSRAIRTFKNKVDVYADLQLRSVRYRTAGVDNDLRGYDVNDDLLFF